MGALDRVDIGYGWVACVDDCIVTVRIYPEFCTWVVQFSYCSSVVLARYFCVVVTSTLLFPHSLSLSSHMDRLPGLVDNKPSLRYFTYTSNCHTNQRVSSNRFELAPSHRKRSTLAPSVSICRALRCQAPRRAPQSVQPNGLVDNDASLSAETVQTEDRHDRVLCLC